MFCKIPVSSFSISFFFCQEVGLLFLHKVLPWTAPDLDQNNPFLFKGGYLYICHGKGLLIAIDINLSNTAKILTMGKLGGH